MPDRTPSSIQPPLGKPASGRRASAKTAVYAPLAGILVVLAAVALGGITESAGPPEPPTLTVEAPRVVVLKSKRVLHLFDGDALVRTYPIDLGRAPAGQKRRHGDCRTPVGSFRVVTKNAGSPYHRFFGIDYPSEPAIERGLVEGLISPGEASSMRAALRASECPDWGTALGGGIGIHGHRLGRDWTAGCIAMADRHVEELFGVLRLGDPVEILP